MISYNKFEDIPADKLHLPRVNNGVEIIVFETVEQHNAYLESIKVWSKEAYVTAISAAVDAMVSAKLLELNYTNFNGEPSVGDVAAGVANTEAEWHLEAVEVNKWYASVYSAMYSHLSEVTEQIAQPIETFIYSLPKFNH